jgi:hypothetical protein
LEKKIFIFAIIVAVVGLLGSFYLTSFGQNWLGKNQTKNQTQAQPTNLENSEISQANETPALNEQSTETKTEEIKKEEPKTEAKEEPKVEEKKPEPKPEPEPVREPSPPSYNRAFQWGVTMRPNAIGNYNSSTWQAQIDKAKNLGTKLARIDWDRGSPNAFTRMGSIIDALRSNGIEPLLVIDYNFNSPGSNVYQDGLNDGKNIGSAFKSKVDFYQMANEGGATSIRSGTLSGVNESDYNQDKYYKVKEYIRGVSDGLAQSDPGSVRIVTISWTHTGFLDKLAKDNISYDMIGIDWYSWMGSFGAKKINGNQTLFSKLKTFGKPLSFMEVALLPGEDPNDSRKKTVVDEERQENFIASHADWALYNRNWFKGFFAFELVDNINSPSEYIDYYGLVKASYNSTGVGVLGSERRVFGSLRNLISGK